MANYGQPNIENLDGVPEPQRHSPPNPQPSRLVPNDSHALRTHPGAAVSTKQHRDEFSNATVKQGNDTLGIQDTVAVDIGDPPTLAPGASPRPPQMTLADLATRPDIPRPKTTGERVKGFFRSIRKTVLYDIDLPTDTVASIIPNILAALGVWIFTGIFAALCIWFDYKASEAALAKGATLPTGLSLATALYGNGLFGALLSIIYDSRRVICTAGLVVATVYRLSDRHGHLPGLPFFRNHFYFLFHLDRALMVLSIASTSTILMLEPAFKPYIVVWVHLFLVILFFAFICSFFAVRFRGVRYAGMIILWHNISQALIILAFYIQWKASCSGIGLTPCQKENPLCKCIT